MTDGRWVTSRKAKNCSGCNGDIVVGQRCFQRYRQKAFYCESCESKRVWEQPEPEPEPELQPAPPEPKPMVEIKGGKPRSLVSAEREFGLLEEDVADLTDQELMVVLELLGKWGHDDLGMMTEPIYSREVVSMEEFLGDDYYLGVVGETIYPALKEDLIELFNGDYHEAILTGSIDLNALVQEADGGLPTLRERIGVDTDVLVLQRDGLEVSTTEPGHHSGTKEVVRLELANGMRLDLTPDHEVQVYRDGVEWVPAGEIEPDELVLTARWIRTEPSMNLSTEAAALLGYWTADGSSDPTRARFCDGNPETSKHVVSLLAELGFKGKREEKGNCWEVHVREVKKSGFLDWLEQHQADRKTHDVLVPDVVCRSDDAAVAAFMNALWACEGTVYAPKSECSPPRFALGMTSERFIRQVQMLLLRFGLRARIREVDYVDKRNGAKRNIWHLVVSGRDQLLRFLDSFGFILGKEEACERVVSYCAGRKGNTNVDIVPMHWGRLNDLMVQFGIKRPAGNEWWRLGTARGRRLSREMFDRWLDVYGETPLGRLLVQWFPRDIAYECVVSVEPMAVHIEVGDIGAHNGHRFISNGMSVHNSIGWGKNCCLEGTLIPTSDGLLPIEQVVSLGAGAQVLTDRGRWRTITTVHDVGMHDTVRIETKWGYVLEGRPNHRVRVVGDGKLEWRRLDEFDGSEVVALDGKQREHWGVIRPHLFEAELMGAWTGDGWFGNNGNSIQFSTGHTERQYREHLKELILDTTGIEPKEVVGETAVRVDIHSRAKVRHWESLGCISGSEHKVVPQVILESSMEAVCAFLRGLFDTDGSVYDSTIEYTSVSEKLIEQVQQLLLGLGIASARWSKPTTHQLAWVLKIRGDESKRRFVQLIGASHCRKRDRLYALLDALDTKTRTNDSDVLHGLRSEMKKLWEWLPSPKSQHRNLFGAVTNDQEVSRTVLKKALAVACEAGVRPPRLLSRAIDDELLLLPVKSVEQSHGHCYDLSVEEDESYVANGFLSHNTFSGVAICRMVYEMSCLRDPQKLFGLESGSEIAFCCLSVNEMLAKRAVFGAIKQKIMTSKYFMQEFPYKPTLSELRFPNNIWVAASSSSMSSALSLNTFGGILDEINFMPETPPRVQRIRHGAKRRERVSHAETLYNMITKRIKSRFLRNGKVPGILLLLSSRSHTDAFTEKRIAASMNDPNVFIRSYCLTGDTRVPLFDGSMTTMRELADAYGDTDERFEVYSCDAKKGHSIVPGRAYRPRLTGKQVLILEVGLDNGKVVRCTGGHPFMLRDGTYCKAEELHPGVSLMPCRRQYSKEGYVRWPMCNVEFVRDSGRADVYDLSVEEHENFCLEAGVVVHNSLWDVKPHIYSSDTFPVLVGNERVRSEIVEDPDGAEKGSALKRVCTSLESDPDYEGCQVLDVPVDFKRDFKVDIDTSLQDLAGVATVSMSPFIQRRETIYDAIDETRQHPMATLEWVTSTDPRIHWDQLTKRHKVLDSRGNASWVEGPIVNPNVPRHVHIDTSLNVDATGVAIVHIADYVTVQRRDRKGEAYEEDVPEYYVDFMLRVIPPTGEDIIMADIRTLLYEFMDHGYHFGLCSTDQYQSVEMRQYMEQQRGVETKLQSMDRTPDPYLELRSALYEGRISYYHYKPFLDEIQRLVMEITNTKQKVDHLPNESKDVCDAMAGSVFTLCEHGDTQPIAPRMGISESPESESPDDWVLEDLPRSGKKPVKRIDSPDDFFMPVIG